MLLILIINDLPHISDYASFILFADDTTIAVSSDDYCTLIADTNDQLVALYEWTINDRLSLNAAKTSALLFTNCYHNIALPLLLSINGVPNYCEQRTLREISWHKN